MDPWRYIYYNERRYVKWLIVKIVFSPMTIVQDVTGA